MGRCLLGYGYSILLQGHVSLSIYWEAFVVGVYWGGGLESGNLCFQANWN
jgi:hypothetical protein